MSCTDHGAELLDIEIFGIVEHKCENVLDEALEVNGND